MSMEIKLRYVYKSRMASGRWRYRYERGGQKVTLRGEPGSKEFYQHYSDLLDGVAEHRETAVKGSVAWLVGKFLSDVETKVGASLASPLTLKGHRHHLGKLVDQHGQKDMRIPRGALTVFLDQYTATPGARDNLRKSISAMYQFAIEREYVSENPAKLIRRINTNTDGFYTCTTDDIKRYLAHHGPGTTARRVMIVAMCTGARREDIRTLGRQNEKLRDGVRWLRWKQSKKPNQWVEIPMLPMLQEEVASHLDGCYILTSRGAPFTHGTLGNYVRKWFEEAGAKGSLHGVRKGMATILAEYGATSYEVDVLLGHELNSAESRTYVRKAERAAIAQSLVSKMVSAKW